MLELRECAPHPVVIPFCTVNAPCLECRWGQKSPPWAICQWLTLAENSVAICCSTRSGARSEPRPLRHTEGYDGQPGFLCVKGGNLQTLELNHPPTTSKPDTHVSCFHQVVDSRLCFRGCTVTGYLQITCPQEAHSWPLAGDGSI